MGTYRAKNQSRGISLSEGAMRSTKLTTVLAVTGVLTTGGSGAYSPATANHIYLTISGPGGQIKNDAGVSAVIEALKFSYSVDVPPTGINTVTGVAVTAGTHHYTPMHFSKYTGLASTELYDAMIHGQPLSVTVDFVDTTASAGTIGQPQLQTRIQLTNAYVIGIQQTSQPPGVNVDDIALIARSVTFTTYVPGAGGTMVVGNTVTDSNPTFVE
jgi:type VI protein secretion system component Hcp